MSRLKRYKKKKKHIPAFIVLISAIFSISLGATIGIYGVKYLDMLFTSIVSSPIPAINYGIANTPSPTVLNKENIDKKNESSNDMNIPEAYLPSHYKNFSSEVLINSKVVKEYNRDYNIGFLDASKYSSLEGVTCFRGNNYRNSPSYGAADIKEQKLEKIWMVKNGIIDMWSGTGWTGQPAIVKWSDEIRNIMNINSSKKSKENLKEVIYATLDGKIYFLDLDDGKPTRNPINVGSPHKGSVAVDPRGYPLLYAGQGIPEVGGKKIPIGFRIYNLINQKQLYFINGMDSDAIRRWGAFDSGALIDSATDSLIECGENGILYSGRLNTNFQPDKKSITIKPELVKYRYRSPISSKIGIENSPVIYKNFIYFADNNGLFQCVDLNTLKTIWVRDVIDDTDSTTVLEETDSGVYLYTANEVDHHGGNGASYIKKLNAFTGELVWDKKIQCTYDSKTNGGALATPVIGKNDIDGLVIYNICKTGTNNNGSTLFALDKKTGIEKWKVQMKYYCWSSPVSVYSKEGKSYIIMCDSAGYMSLYEGTTGKLLDSLPLEANIEASPAVYENIIVVGTRGCKIWGIKIK